MTTPPIVTDWVGIPSEPWSLAWEWQAWRVVYWPMRAALLEIDEEAYPYELYRFGEPRGMFVTWDEVEAAIEKSEVC
jgi:hypothetical protein